MTRPSPVERKVAAVLGVPASEAVDSTAVANALAQDLAQYVLNTIADPDRGVDRIEHEADDGEHVFLGYAGSTLRLLVGVVVDTSDNTAEITLRATKADRDALDDTDWGDAAPNVGNSVLVARVFHVGLVTLRRCGIEAVVNRPFDARVRARYTAMGFHRGERLDLTSRAALGKAFAFVGRVYADHDLDLDAPPP
jgi:Fe2+ transport system protein FeoA